MMSDEWGPWIEHDGRGCPVAAGVITLKQYGRPRAAHWGGLPGAVFMGEYFVISISSGSGSSWNWSTRSNPILRYRIRKPKGLMILEGLIAELPAPTVTVPEGADVTAHVRAMMME